jgi:carboxymethylenebutenolidase
LEDISRISVPVYGFYGENDQRINATIPQTEELMKNAGKTYKYENPLCPILLII